MSIGYKQKNVEGIERNFTMIRTLIGVGIALLLALVLIAAVSDRPWQALLGFLIGPFTSVNRMGSVVEKAIPLVFTGTAVCIIFSCGQISLAVEGTFYLTGIACAAVATKQGLPPASIRSCAFWQPGRPGQSSARFRQLCILNLIR